MIYAESGRAKIQALRMAWPIACRRLEDLPNISATQLFEELWIQFSRADLPWGSTRRCSGTSIAGAKALGLAAWSLGQRHTGVSATNLAAAGPTSSMNTGRRW